MGGKSSPLHMLQHLKSLPVLLSIYSVSAELCTMEVFCAVGVIMIDRRIIDMLFYMYFTQRQVNTSIPAAWTGSVATPLLT